MKRIFRSVVMSVFIAFLFSSVPGFSSQAPQDIILMIDNSGSMQKNDPSRLVKHAVEGFIGNLPPDAQMGILLFGHKINLAVPLIKVDEKFRGKILSILEKIDFAGRYSRIPSAMEKSIYELKSKGREGSQKSIIFITDGIIDTGDKKADAEKKKWLMESLSDDAARTSIRIFGIALTEGSDFELIQSLALKTGGEYYRILSANDIDQIFSKIKVLLSKTQTTGIKLPPQVVPETTKSPITDVEKPEPTAIVHEKPEEAPQTSLSKTSPAAATETVIGRAKHEEIPISTDPEKKDIKAGKPVSKKTGLSGLKTGMLAVIIVLLFVIVLFRIKNKPKKKLEKTGPKIIYQTQKNEPSFPFASLKDVQGITGQIAFELDKDVTIIGRDAANEMEGVNNIIIPRGTISRQHAAIQRKGDAFFLKDLGSTNGTLLNNQEVLGEKKLKHGDAISFDVFEFKFITPKEAKADKLAGDQTVIRNPNETIDEESIC